jgi:Xaa-Pro dipeptidase
MKRREFLKFAGASGAALALPGLERGGLARPLLGPDSGDQGIDPLPLSIFQRRLERARDLMSEYGLVALFTEPSTSFTYLTDASFGRSERLIALVLPAQGGPLIVAPKFEVERVSRAVKSVADIRGWEEHESPYRLVADAVWASGPGRIGIEPSTRYGVVRQLDKVLPDWEFVDADPLFRGLRITKSEEEIKLIRRAVSITETSIAASFASLQAGVTDRELASYLRDQMRQRGASGGGLVQFGPTSALPHGGTEGRRLEHGMPVLIDAGCRVHGYTSDITRMHFFGDEPSPQYREVFNTVFAAQTAAYEAAGPGMECQQLDRIARRVIEEAGYGKYFTHRLGHGMGMDGHEPPYLVEGNTQALQYGMIFTIEPGIYLPGQWGVRIEDDFVVREDGLEPLSSRVAQI